MATHETIRLPVAARGALVEALDSGDPKAIAEAARAILDADSHEVTAFVGPQHGSAFRVASGKPVALLWPRRNGADITIPVVLKWLKKPVLTEARGSVADAEAMIALLREAIDSPTDTPDTPTAEQGRLL